MNIGVFASGRGSNFQAILDAIHQRILSARVSLLLSNKSDAGALEIARAHQIPAVHLSQKQFADEPSFAAAMAQLLTDHDVQIIALAGYLKKIPVSVVREYRNRILNIHPALLPSFGGHGMYGHFVHEAVIASGAKLSGATVHLVDEEYDRGPIVLQQSVPVGGMQFRQIAFWHTCAYWHLWGRASYLDLAGDQAGAADMLEQAMAAGSDNFYFWLWGAAFFEKTGRIARGAFALSEAIAAGDRALSGDGFKKLLRQEHADYLKRHNLSR